MLSNDLIYLLPDGGYLVIPENIILKCRSFTDGSKSFTEAGGVLIGCVREGNNIEITDLTVPGYGDTRKGMQFIRNGMHHLIKVFTTWGNSGGTDTYMGEWHTHPEQYPTPSSIDKNSWNKKLPSRKLILMIVGYSGVWLALWDNKKLIQLNKATNGISGHVKPMSSSGD